MLQSTSAGSRDTAAKELTVIPIAPRSGSLVVKTHTPVANCPSVFLSARVSKTYPYIVEGRLPLAAYAQRVLMR